MERLIGKRILVTGGTGFVGSHVAEALLAKHASVVVPYRSIDPRSYFATASLAQRTILSVCDVTDARRIFDVVTKYEIEYIFHLAALATVTAAYHNPLESIVTNVVGTANVLEAARRFPGVKGVIVASSDKAYGKSHKPSVETDRLAGDHPYEASKSSMDLLSSAYIKTYGTPVVITRFGNIYGPGDNNYSRIVPGIMQSMVTGMPLELRSDGTYMRDYVYVGDVARAYLFMLEHLEEFKGEAFNISTGVSLSVLQLIKKSEKILKKKINYRFMRTAKNEIPYQHLDCTKITKLGWRPTYTLEKGLRLSYRWYTKHNRNCFGIHPSKPF
ncbi:NAD-dependent epimerase/dehydratase family protein [Candidatus Gottesmanbacteria bacterium]|nr:NAD-dependent epimerase/dehydratase family protein [Candidatus Gottesmanbacteria bacterium]